VHDLICETPITANIYLGTFLALLHRESPRTEQLVGVAREFANTWVSLVTKGPSSDRISCLTQLSAPGLTLRSTHPLGCVSVKVKLAQRALIVSGGTDIETPGLSAELLCPLLISSALEWSLSHG
jgi:hypothetical protein